MSMQTVRVALALAAVSAAVAAVPAHAHAHGPNHPDALSEATAGLASTSRTGVFAQPLSVASAGPVPTTVATILSISDFHGRLNPTTFRVDAGGQQFGGAAYLQSYFKQRAALSPSPPFLVTQGDAVGATQPVSSLLGDRPTIDVMNRMGFDADTLGNHNFDDGVEHMAELARGAKFPYLVTNLKKPGGKAPAWTKPSTVWDVDGVPIGVTGAINDDAASLLRPGLLGNLSVRPAHEGINAAAAELRAKGVNTVVALAHFGADPTTAGTDGAKGPLIELAKKLRGVDVLLGDHTYWQVNQPVIGDDGQPLWVVQSVPNGISFSEVKLTINQLDGAAIGVAVDQFPVVSRLQPPGEADQVEVLDPDPEIAALVDSYNQQVAPLVDEPIGSSTRSIPENVAVAEANQGNVVTDALRAATGATLAIYNSGGLRAALTAEDRRDSAGNYLITRGAVLGMLPFNNQITLVTVSGAELKTMLENGVSQMPTPAARFPQISGFSFRFRPTQPPNARVTSATLDDGTPIAFTDAAKYRLVTNEFVATKGDGYPDFTGRLTYAGDVEDAVIAYLQNHPALVPPGPPHEEPRRIVVE